MKAVDESVFSLARLRNEVVGINTIVPLLDGTQRRYVFLDNAASTPTFQSVLRCVQEFLPWYAGVKRGVGLKARVATDAYDEAHSIVGTFVGADPGTNVVVFVGNTTEAINRLANRFRMRPDDVVITTVMEHHSNDLPWRKQGQTIHVGILSDGSIDTDQLKEELKRNAGKVKLVAVSGASNVTGICNPIHEIAEWVHAAGAKIFVDAAQLAPHRPITMLHDDDPRHIDFLAFSGHKIYAPFGVGVLIGPRDFFDDGAPEIVGGGTVSYVGLDEVEWTGLPQKEEPGSPNVVGAVALGCALAILENVGLKRIAEHELHLLQYAMGKMQKIAGVRLYGPTDNLSGKLGVLPFTVEGMDHALVATILSVEGGIAVRNGNFCAQPYMRQLLGVTPEEEKKKRADRCDNPMLPGMVRASLGCYNNEDDIDHFIQLLERISQRNYKGKYSFNAMTGLYEAHGFDVQPTRHFHLLEHRPDWSHRLRAEVR